MHALDLRICKAAESITIFDEENVLALTSSSGPEKIRKKHLSERFCPYLSTSNSSTSSRLNNNSSEDEIIPGPNHDQERLTKEKEWMKNFRNFQSSAERDPTYVSSWSQRLNDISGSQNRSPHQNQQQQHHQQQRQDCYTPGCQRGSGFMTSSPAVQRFHQSVHENGPSPNPHGWLTMKDEPRSPLPTTSVDRHFVESRHGSLPPPLAPLNPPHPSMLRNKFDQNYFLPPFPGHDLMKANTFFQRQPQHSQQFLMAAAAQHRQHQLQQHQQYKMNPDTLRKKIFSMQNENCYKPNNYVSDPFYPQRHLMNGPPPLLPFENRNGTEIKQEPNTSHTRHSSAEDRRTPTNLSSWPRKSHIDTINIKEEHNEDEEPREKFNPDKLRSTFLWHVLQRHSSQQRAATVATLPPEDASFTEIDDRLKSIEQASGLYNNQKSAGRLNHVDLSPERNVRSQLFHHDVSPAPTPMMPFGRPQHMNGHHLFSKLKVEGEEEKDLNGAGSDFKVEKSKFFKERLMTPHSPESSLGDANDVTSPYSVTSPYTSTHGDAVGNGRRGRPRKHAPKVPLPPIYVFIRNLLYNRYYNPRVVSWVNESYGIFRVNNTNDFARTWGLMKTNRGVKMNYEKLSRAMRYHYGSIKQGRKGHLAMVKEKRLFYRFGELAVNWRSDEVQVKRCERHDLCKQSLCLWTKE